MKLHSLVIYMEYVVHIETSHSLGMKLHSLIINTHTGYVVHIETSHSLGMRLHSLVIYMEYVVHIETSHSLGMRLHSLVIYMEYMYVVHIETSHGNEATFSINIHTEYVVHIVQYEYPTV